MMRNEGLNILIVDDTASIRKMVQIGLIQRSYVVATAAGGQEALDLLGSGGLPDLMLLDQSMPDMDGLTTFAQVKILYPDIPVIMVTAQDTVTLAVEFMRRGGDMFVGKPINFDLLDVVIQQVMRGARHRQAQRAAEVAQMAAEKASAAKSLFIQNISHEMRTPLTVVLSFAEQAEDEVRDGDLEGAIRHLGHIVSNAEHLTALIDDFLELSHTMIFDITPFSLFDVVRGVVNRRRLAAENRGLTIFLHDSAETPLLVQGNELRLGRAIDCLIVNAVAFATEGTDINVALDRDGEGHVVLTVANQGIGIPPEELVSIFDPGTQSSFTENGSGGTGLGLALCRSIIVAHGGSVFAENAPSGWVVFTCVFPA